MSKVTYPEFLREDVKDTFGKDKVEISDPYRWMENPDDSKTEDFVKKQQELFNEFVKPSTIKEKYRDRLEKLWDYPKYGGYRKAGTNYYHHFNSGLQNQAVMYIHKKPEEDGVVFFDPNTLSADGTVALRSHSFSDDGRYWAYSLSDGGSDWITIKFREIFEDATWKDLPDTLTRVKFSSMAWTHDGNGFFYNRYPVSDDVAHGKATDENINQKLFYHKIGTDQKDDILCAEFPEHPQWMVGAEVSDCGRYLLLTPEEGCDPKNRLFYCDLAAINYNVTGKLDFVKVVDNFDAQYEYITNEGTLFTFKTNLNAPRYKLITIDFAKPAMADWKVLIEQDPKDVLEFATCKNNKLLFCCYIHDVKHQLRIHDLDTGKKLDQEVPLEICEIILLTGKKRAKEIFMQITTFLSPGKIFYWNFNDDPDLKQGPKLLKEIQLDISTSDLVVKQVFYPSKDGCKIPMFIVHNKNLILDGSNQTWLYGYGGFNISLLPSFSISRLVFLKHFKGIYCLANIRGGGEYGETWHKDGSLGKKQNCFDDFESAAEYLIKEKYTSQRKLVISGGSNGGLLVAACCNQRPELFGCGVAEVGVLDMLRFHKFTIGHAWTTDYGCADDEEQFEWLIKYSPLHNIPDPKAIDYYPALLLVTADHDDRVVPSHSLKYTAEIQHKLGKNPEGKPLGPVLMRIESRAGHGAGRPTSKIVSFSFGSKIKFKFNLFPTDRSTNRCLDLCSIGTWVHMVRLK